MKWIESSTPVDVDDSAKKDRFSIVYSKDVVDLLYSIVVGQLKIDDSNLCQSYNIACEEHPTLYQLIQSIVMIG